MTSSSEELFQFFCLQVKIMIESCSTRDIYASTFSWCSHGIKNMYNWAGEVSRSDSTCIMQSDLMCLPLLNLRVLRPLQSPVRLQTLARTRLVLPVLLWPNVQLITLTSWHLLREAPHPENILNMTRTFLNWAVDDVLLLPQHLTALPSWLYVGKSKSCQHT